MPRRWSCAKSCGTCLACLVIFCVALVLFVEHIIGEIHVGLKDLPHPLLHALACDPTACCKLDPIERDICDTDSGLPRAQFEHSYLSCILGTNNLYRRTYSQSVVPCLEFFHLVGECGHEYGKEWAEQLDQYQKQIQDEMNASLPISSKLPPLPDLSYLSKCSSAEFQHNIKQIDWHAVIAALRNVDLKQVKNLPVNVSKRFMVNTETCVGTTLFNKTNMGFKGKHASRVALSTASIANSEATHVGANGRHAPRVDLSTALVSTSGVLLSGLSLLAAFVTCTALTWSSFPKSAELLPEDELRSRLL
eukprot:gnl/TRDRNA2_/TRDRNA2_88881_c0_seq2.p1 gnl/TRDRNA2_/TRDRNA2_88881_c0~~gnl/TRDRNA2_/TRDRNA2_88881_c0_seq2.p1  ORF type:complete len:306 (-),score=16.58 gnl/TRDRNA2_/TRDRNA2_88881_c0_seq2:51-968(-)